MPALLAYLVALAVLIGGGYGGLHYLSEHKGSELTQVQQAKLAARKKFEREAATRLADRDSDADEQAVSPLLAATATPSASPGEAPAAAVEPAVVVPAIRQIAIDAPVVTAPEGNRSVAAAEAAAPLPAPRPAAAPADIATAPVGSTAKPADAMAAVAEPVAPAAAKPARKPRRTAAREQPVLMTLQTIQYADGRIAQRLVPLQTRRRPTQLSRSDWFGGEYDDD